MSPLWWTLISTVVLGVGIGVLAQPQLVVRFMTVKSDRELNRGVIIGAVGVSGSSVENDMAVAQAGSAAIK